MRVYKLLRAAEWTAFDEAGSFAGSPDDLRDGFVHLSTAEQLPGTFARYFATEADAIVAVFNADALGSALRWEPSRGGALFPHLYRGLRHDEIVEISRAADDPRLH